MYYCPATTYCQYLSTNIRIMILDYSLACVNLLLEFYLYLLAAIATVAFIGLSIMFLNMESINEYLLTV